MMETLIQDLRYGIRMLAKKPGFTAVAVITLALGIGATTSIFSVINAVLLNPLPYKDAEQLVMLWRSNPERGWKEFPTSIPNFMDWKERNEVFEEMAAYTTGNFNLAGEGEPEVIQGAWASASLFDTLSVEPVQGRGFMPHEDRPGASRVVVLSYGLWQRRFGADPDAIGKTLMLEAQPHTIIGVMPPSFDYPNEAQLWTTLALDPERAPRGNHFLSVIARLKSGASLEQAQSNMETVSSQLEEQYPQTNAGSRADIVPLREQMVGKLRMALLVLFGAIGFVLLIACANVANLLLVRAADRLKEMAVRSALGASRLRLMRQLLTESVLLAALGGAAGLLIAVWGLDLLISFSPLKIARLNEVSIDGRVLAFMSAIVFLTGTVFGLMPAFRVSDSDFRESLKEGAGRTSAGPARQRLRSGLAVAEIALSLVLLVGAGLFIRSFLTLRSVDPGINPEGVLTLNVVLPQPRYPDPASRTAFYQQVTERIKALPGVRSAASAAYVPASTNNTSRRFAIDGRPLPEPGQEPVANDIPVNFDYFQTLGIPLRAGRVFTDRDDAQAPGVVVVSESFAHQFFPGEEVIGKRIRFYSSRGTPPWLEIVGMVGDVRQRSLDVAASPIMYVPHAQYPWSFGSFLVRTTGDPLSMVGAVKSAVQAVDKDQPVSNVATLEQLLAGSIAQHRGIMLLLGVFAAVALALATVGIYGVISYSVSQRTHEIGIRMALGAGASDIFKIVVGQGVALTVAGIAVGLAASLVLTRYLSSLLFEVSVKDPVTFAIISLLLAAVALLASYIPARRATKVDPMIALRHE